MINPSIKSYPCWSYSNSINEYGQRELSEINAEVHMSISVITQSVSESPLYSTAEYIGIINESSDHSYVDDSYVIEYEGKKLKVLYVTPSNGRFKTAYMRVMS